MRALVVRARPEFQEDFELTARQRLGLGEIIAVRR